ncbi:MAG: hypothetical protein WD934_04715 [Gemmatimonadales bacterium]
MVTLLMGITTPLEAQNAARIIPTNQAVLTGYGTVGYFTATEGPRANAFTVSVSPVFLYQFLDRFLFEVELEFSLTEGVTETGLEYGQLDFFLNDNLTLVGGKFLVPFGIFGERLHPTWINRFATSPPIYGHHLSKFGADPIFPILADVGIMARAAMAPGPWQLGLSAYATQGPTGDAGQLPDVPELDFLGSSQDNNQDKMLGARLDVALPPQAEISGSYLNGDWDGNGVLDLTAWNLAAEFRLGGAEWRGEFIRTSQEYETLTAIETLTRTGFYGQVSRPLGPVEPVLRWTQIFDNRVAGVAQAATGARQLGLGLNYWFGPSIVLMAGYERNRENGTESQNDRLVTHVAFGF